MNRFSNKAGSPKKGFKKWNESHHLTPSRANHKMTTHYKEFFTKRSGGNEWDRDPIKYPLRTIYDGRRRNSQHEEAFKTRFNHRLPIVPREFSEKKDKESTFVGNFHLMASRDNRTKHRLEREYFDRPFLTVRDAPTGFAPVISKPRLLAAAKTPRALEIPSNEGMS